jgi:hypothetical protein
VTTVKNSNSSRARILVQAIEARDLELLEELVGSLRLMPGRQAHDILDRGYVKLAPEDRHFLQLFLDCFTIGREPAGPQRQPQETSAL